MVLEGMFSTHPLVLDSNNRLPSFDINPNFKKLKAKSISWPVDKLDN